MTMNFDIVFNLLTVTVCHVFLFVVNGHKVKVNQARVHGGAHNVHHVQEETIHLRESGLENFAELHKDQAANVLHVEKFVRNKEHIKGHAKGHVDIDIDNASDAELDFHFFQIHDNDDNKALDGLELLEAIMHGLEEQFEDIEDDDELNDHEKKDEAIILYNTAYNSVDRVLRDDDRNRDGYLSVDEFINSRRLTNVIREAHGDEY